MSLVWSPDYNPPAQGHLIYTIDTTTGGTTPSNVDFNLRSFGTVDYRVVWDTSVEETSTSNTLLHTYGSAGTYDVQIFSTGTYRPFFNDVSADVDQITKVSVGGAVELGTSLARAWFGADSMTEFECNFSATSSVLDFFATWRECTSLTSFPLIDTSSGTSFNNTWFNCSNLTNFPLLNSSLVTNFTSTWFNCSSLASFPAIDTSSVTSFVYTWYNCRSLTSFPAINTSSATNFTSCWQGCNSLANFPANFFDASPCTNYTNAFYNCALTAQSVENILVSIESAGTSNGTLGIDSGTNAAKTTWSSAATTAYNALVGRGWTIAFNP